MNSTLWTPSPFRGGLRTKATLVLAALLIFTADLGGAFAQETITVSARKREESFIDVPVAMQVFNTEDTDRYSVTDLTELSELAAQVQLFPASSGSGAAFVVRGISATTLDPGVNTSVAINLDGMGISRGRIVRQGMFDMASVEILKGPQALFFGKNSPAGVVSIQSAGPGDAWEFIFKLNYEFEADEVIGEAIISGPVTDKFGFRLAYQGSGSEGYLKNVAEPQSVQPALIFEPFEFPGRIDDRLGAYEQHMGRLTLQFDPTDNFSATLKVLASTMENDGTGSLNEIVSCSGDRPLTGAVFAAGQPATRENLLFGLEDPDGDCALNGVLSAGALPEEIRANYQGLEDLDDGHGFASYDSLLITLNMDWTFENFILTSVTGYHYYDWFRWDNFDGTTFIQLMGVQDEQSKVFSQELRLLSTFDGPFNFMIGGFYEKTDRDSDNQGKIASVGVDVDVPANGIAPGFPPVDHIGSGFSNNWAGFSTVKGDSWSFFAQGIWDITPDVELAGGVRYSHEDWNAVNGILYSHLLLQAIFLPPGVVLDPEFSDNNWSPEATLTWKATDNITLYVAYKTGYKAGGFSTQTIIGPNDTNEGIIYQAEEADGFEIGFKSSLLDNRLRLNATVYRYNFDGIQDSLFNAATTNFTIINADSRATGFELDATFAVDDFLILRGQVGYNEAKYREFLNAPCFQAQTAAEGCGPNLTGLGGPSMVQDLSGAFRPLAPKWVGSVGFSYDRPFANGLMWGLTGDVIFTDDYITQVANQPGSGQDSTTRINASLRIYSEDGRWEFAIIGRNLTNEYYVSGTADKPGGARGDIFGQVLRARQISIQLTFRG